MADKPQKGAASAPVETPLSGAPDGDSLISGLDIAEGLAGDLFADASVLGGFGDIADLPESSESGSGESAGDTGDGESDGAAVFSLSDHQGGNALFDGADGVDSLRIVLNSSEFSELRDELSNLQAHVEAGGDSSSGDDDGDLGDDSNPGARGAVFTTSFGLTVKDVPHVEFHVEGIGPVSLNAGFTDADEDLEILNASAKAYGLDNKIKGSKDGDDIVGTSGDDVIRGGKGDDMIDGDGGDDWIRGGHDEDILDGGSGSDIVDGGKGDDMLVVDLTQNMGAEDRYDGGKGSDTLVLHMTEEQFTAFQQELIDLDAWITENADPGKSTGHGFSDKSWHSKKHPIYELELEDEASGFEYELTVRNVEDLKIFVVGFDGEIDPVAGLPVAEDPDEPDIIVGPPTEGTVFVGGDGTDLAIGTQFNDILDGAGGDDLFVGGAGDDLLTGGTGNDLFIFATGSGNDTITDFEAGVAGGDLIDLRQMTSVADFTMVMAAAADVVIDGVASSFIDFGGGDSLTLLGVATADYDQGDFLLF